jgi:eukaryotic-like serine/threonine-protein kinase
MATPAADRLVADRYALKASIGRGGMGVVWRARDTVLGREVAVKEVVFPPTMPEEERRPAQARVMREARAAARLNHPAAVVLYDVVQDHGGTFIVMELVDAPTLADVVRRDGPLSVERAAEIGAQVASALEAAHQAGIVHRDVKPGNVMVPANGMAKLADFGIASLQGDPQLTSTGLVIGSPAYMAPEQAKGEESGPPADFWALGATIFYAVEGEPPFDRGTSIATLAAVVNEPPRAPRRAGPLAPLLTALLAKDPAARPSGPTIGAWLNWLRVVALPSAPDEVLRTQRQGRAGSLAPPSSASASAATPAPPAVTPSAGLPQRSVQTSAFEPNQAPTVEPPRSAPVQQTARPVLPPAPPVPLRAGRRLLGLVALLLVGGMLTAWLTGTFPSDPIEDRAAPATTSANAGVNSGQERAAPAPDPGWRRCERDNPAGPVDHQETPDHPGTYDPHHRRCPRPAAGQVAGLHQPGRQPPCRRPPGVPVPYPAALPRHRHRGAGRGTPDIHRPLPEPIRPPTPGLPGLSVLGAPQPHRLP